MRGVTKRPLLLVLAVLILLDIASIQTVLSRNKDKAVTQGVATATRTPTGTSPVTVSPPGAVGAARPSPTPTADATATPKGEEPVADDEGGPPESASVIRVNGSSFAGRPFETIPLRGSYPGADAGTILRVQAWVDGAWVDFPLPTTTDGSGRFTAHVELGSPGEHRVRVVDQKSGTASETIIVVIR
jgi:hypothetical protein